MSVWTKELADQVRHMREVDGLMFWQIAAKLGLTKNQVTAKYHRMTGRKAENERDRPKKRAWDAELKGWDSRTFLPYAEWRKWHRNRLKERDNVEV